MKEYFLLQYIHLNRKLIDFGFRKVTIAYISLLLLFLLASFYLFMKSVHASWIYVAISICLTSSLSKLNRNDFLKICFNKSLYLQIRLLENLIVSAPFLIFLLFQASYSQALLLAILSFSLIFVRIRHTFKVVIPTPFYKKPFEFIIGFRYTFFLIVLLYYVVIMAIIHDNINLGIVALLVLFFIIASFYMAVENEYFVWIHNLTPRQFLLQKVKIALRYTVYLSVPMVIILGLFNRKEIPIILLTTMIGYSWVVGTVFAKYSRYPKMISLPQTLLLITGFVCPPVLIFTIPYFYKHSEGQLKKILQ